MIISSICCHPRNLTDTCNACFQNHYLIFIYKMGFQCICGCILIYLSGITLNKITDVMLYNEMHLYICPKLKDLLCNQLSTTKTAPGLICFSHCILYCVREIQNLKCHSACKSAYKHANKMGQTCWEGVTIEGAGFTKSLSEDLILS